MEATTAQDLFNHLYMSLIRNGFSDVGTFLSSLSKNEDENSEIQDNSTALIDLYDKAQNPKNSNEALTTLVLAAYSYFTFSSRLPTNYFEQLGIETETPGVTKLEVIISDDKTIDSQEVLQNENVERMVKLLGLVSQFAHNDDRTFISEISKFY